LLFGASSFPQNEMRPGSCCNCKLASIDFAHRHAAGVRRICMRQTLSSERETAAAQISLTRALCFCFLSRARSSTVCVVCMFGPCDEIINGCANSELLCVHRQLFLRVVYNENKSQGSTRQILQTAVLLFYSFCCPAGRVAPAELRNFKKLS